MHIQESEIVVRCHLSLIGSLSDFEIISLEDRNNKA